MKKFEVINRPLHYNGKVILTGRSVTLDETHAQILISKGRIKENTVAPRRTPAPRGQARPRRS
jgi:hypothetical protein